MSKASNIVEDWLEADGLMLLESWARDGYTIDDIATRIGVSNQTFWRWMRQYPEIKQAVKQGRELVDYKVENALLKAALGYQTKEVRVSTIIRNGKTIETQKETVTREQAPNVSACQVWLYNRLPKKWRNMNSRSALLDEMDEDTSIHITVERANPRPETEGGEDDKEWQAEVNTSLSVRKATPEERAEAEKAKRRAKQEEEKSLEDIGVKVSKKASSGKKPARASSAKESSKQSAKVHDVDYWPDDWEDDE